MYPRNRNDRSDSQNYNRNAGYEERFGSAGQKGSHRYAEFEPETYGAQGRHHGPAHGDYSTFEGATNRPYYGGEEGSFPYGGMSSGDTRHAANRSYNADENYASSSSRSQGLHSGKGPKGYRRSDERIHEEVSEMLMENGDIDATEIEVMVNEGVVHLSGSVESRRIKRMAEDLIERVNGVVDIRNDLQVVAHGSGSRPQYGNFESESLQSQQSSANAARQNNKEGSSRTAKKKSSSSRQISQ